MRSLLRREGGRCGEGGQAIVESALVLPLYVFLMLGTLQIGLMHQARLLTKYAAFHAARTGALNQNDPAAMEKAAMAVLLPMFAFNPAFFSDQPGHFFIRADHDAGDLQSAKNYAWSLGKLTAASWVGIEVPPAHVRICGPGKEDFGDYYNEYGRVDFDDPKVASGVEWHAGNEGKGNDPKHWQAFQATKLRVQVTFNYRMPIPFANRIIAQLFLAQEVNRVALMEHFYNRVSPDLGVFEGLGNALMQQLLSILQAFQNRRYIIPIRANYNMRMMSNIDPDVKDFPESLQKSECMPWTA